MALTDWSETFSFSTYPEDIFIEPFDNSNNWTLASQNEGSISEVADGLLKLYSDGSQHYANATCLWDFKSIPEIGWEFQVTIDCPVYDVDYHNDSYIYSLDGLNYISWVYKRWTAYSGLWVSINGQSWMSNQILIPGLPEQIRLRIVFDAINTATVSWKNIGDSDWTPGCTKTMTISSETVMYVLLSNWNYGPQWVYYDDVYIRGRHVVID